MPIPIYPETKFAKFVFTKLYETGKTRKQLAEEVGISICTVDAYAQKKRFPKYSTLCGIAKALEIDVDYLAELVKEDKRADKKQ